MQSGMVKPGDVVTVNFPRRDSLTLWLRTIWISDAVCVPARGSVLRSPQQNR